MVDTKKEQERDELHRAIWAIADELRGAVDGWDFKNYVLGTMFYRYISENLCSYINDGEIKAGNTDFNFATMPDDEAEEARDGLVEEKGFFILPSELFCNVRAKAANDENLNETLESVFRHIEESAKGSEAESDFAGLFDDYDVNSNKLGSTVAKRNEKLVKLLNGVGEMNLGAVKDHTFDAFGDAYEYLMSMYASNAGKSGGEFYTPADVSELLTRLGTVGKTEINKVYDPACGSGSLLLKAEKVLGKDAIRNGFYGQEINITTYNLCRINMFLHDVGFDKFNVACEDTLISPQHWDDEPFELIVSNPPYSIKWEGDENPLLINDPRFSPAGVLAPKSKADMAFIMHSLSWLASNGTAAIVCFPGIMYRGGAEQKIRKYLVDNNYVDCIIQLPSNLFFGTSIATCIMVMKKNKNDNKTLFIDASNECIKVTNNNKLTPENIDRIVDVFSKREEVAHFSHVADYDEITGADYNLSVSTYVEAEDTREKIDIVKLNAEIEEIVMRENELREAIRNIIEEIEVGDRKELLTFTDDVKKVPLIDVVKIKRGVRVVKSQLAVEGEYPVFQNSMKPLGYMDKANCTGDTAFIITAGAAGEIGYTDNDFWAADDCFSFECPQYLKSKYLYYILLCQQNTIYSKVRKASIPRLPRSAIEKLIIPVPSVDIQEKIVDVLDRFDTLCNDISKGLPAEIVARQKQYEYYRDKLLTFKEFSDEN